MNEFLIKIKSLWDASGNAQATEGLKALGSEVDNVGKKAEKSRSALAECVAKGSALGSAIGGGIFAFAEGALNLVERVGDKIKELALEGLAFNRAMQDAQIGIAGGFRSVDPSLGFADAKQRGGEAIDSLKQKSLDLGINFEALVETFKINIPTMWEAGIRDTQKMINLITLLNQVAAFKGIDGFQAQRDIIDILNGMGQRTILGKELEANGVSNESIKSAKEQGTLYELITTKLAAYGESGKAASETQTAALQRLHTAWTSLLGDFTKPFAQSVTDGLNTISEALKNIVPSTKTAAQGIADFFGGLVSAGKAAAGLPPPPEWLQKYLNYQSSGIRAVGSGLAAVSTWASTLLTGSGETNRIYDEVIAQENEGAIKDADNFKKQKALRLYGRQHSVEFQPTPEFDSLNRMEAQDEAVAEQIRQQGLTPEQKIDELKRKDSKLRTQTADSNTSKEDADKITKQVLQDTKEIDQLNEKITKDKKTAADTAKKDAEKAATNATKLEELRLETQLNEAKAAGNDKLAEKLEWQQKYNSLLKEYQGIGDKDAFADAIRGANAATSSPIEKAKSSIHLSELGRSGGAMAETARAAVVDKTAAHLEAISTTVAKLISATDTMNTHLQVIADKKGGYQ